MHRTARRAALTIVAAVAAACGGGGGPDAVFTGEQTPIEVTVEAGGTATVELKPRTGVYIRDEQNGVVNVTPGDGVQMGDPFYAYWTEDGGTITISFEGPAESHTVQINECMNMVGSGICG